ncbi:hypothetical protein DH2020_016316 [Rehmannia glutinosa]|uniref:NB-ARC domain-containing protein n=1 Tax=Rehmannia glutinosa TaxID=99300 RepID=A0ABR0WML9_REHGL
MVQNMTRMGFDDVLIEIMDKLTGQQSNRQIIPIVGMGGIGKTTLARNIYVNPLIVHHFDILAWTTISQEYNAKESLLEVLLCLKTIENRESLSQFGEDVLGEKLYKSLLGRRYLIVMDDIWNIKVWDKMKFFFPNNSNGSRILITTRLSNLASELSGSHGHEMNFLDEEKSWDLLRKHVFGEESFPLELEETGKKIAKSCKGLPLSIVVVGGFLAKSQKTRAYWEYVAENLNSIVNLEDDKRCLKILYMSYKQLPVHLKPCFLYMGVFPEDARIRVSRLIKLWVAEGFLKPVHGKSLEMVAEEYLEDLIHRNLILVSKLGSTGKIKFCNIHDLLRDLCLSEAQRERFLSVVKMDRLKWDRARLGMHENQPRMGRFFKSFDSGPVPASLTRSLICDFLGDILPSLKVRLLRVLEAVGWRSMVKDLAFMKAILQLVNLRYLVPDFGFVEVPRDYFCSIHRFWNLQTLIVESFQEITAPIEFWKMTHLRHINFYRLHLPDPHICRRDDFILGNLQTLQTVMNFEIVEKVVKRIPNIKKLKIHYMVLGKIQVLPYCLNNLGRLHKLEFLTLSSNYSVSSEIPRNLSFPHSLKKLTLQHSRLHWEDVTTKIGSLPHLQVIKLRVGSFIGPEWETVEGQFCSLKFLLIEGVNLEHWRTDSTHFPCLEHLILRRLYRLKEIPSEIGEISTLQSIELQHCADSAIISAKEILKEQEDLGNIGLHVRVRLRNKNKVVECLASHNFIVDL